ncbi:hypothetical protein [Bradyrhizobium sp. SRS-191]|uniref:hypothetical protein n=1 Tax=Bradyrhizobium sp. SRS-191 TaxID=2962606 RepID=UPI00211E7FE0|nr:hypothetical protein [Bradyrhizobium sp. SRS-191]
MDDEVLDRIDLDRRDGGRRIERVVGGVDGGVGRRRNAERKGDAARLRLGLQLPVTPVAKEYSYDALYRLVGATGRSRLADNTIAPYSQALSYDRSDNLISVRHSPAGSRDDLAIAVAPASNRAVAQAMTTAGKTVDGFFDAAGNLTALESGSTLAYDFAGRLVTATAAATAAAYR